MTDNIKNATTELSICIQTLNTKLDLLKNAVNNYVFKSLDISDEKEIAALCAEQLITADHKKFKSAIHNNKSLHISDYFDEQQHALTVNAFNIIGNHLVSLFDLIQTKFESEDNNPDYFTSKQTEILELLFKPVISKESKKKTKTIDATKTAKILLPFEIDSLFEFDDQKVKRCSAICIKDELYLRCRNKVSKNNTEDFCTKCTTASEKFNNLIFTEEDRVKEDFAWHNNKKPIDYYCFAAKKKYTMNDILSQCKTDNIKLSNDLIQECEQKLNAAYEAIAKDQNNKPKTKAKKSTEPVTNYINQAMKRNTKSKKTSVSSNNNSETSSDISQTEKLNTEEKDEKDNNESIESILEQEDIESDEDEYEDAIEEDDDDVNDIELLEHKTLGTKKYNYLAFTSEKSKYYGKYLYTIKKSDGSYTFYFDTDDSKNLKKVSEEQNEEMSKIIILQRD